MERIDQPVPDRVRREVDRLAADDSVVEQGIRWRPDRWLAAALGTVTQKVEAVADRSEAREGCERLVRRRHVWEADDPVERFMASMIWGFGLVGYGPSRVAKIIRHEGTALRPKLEGIAAAASSGHDEAWQGIVRTHKIRGLGPAFGTKVAYFAGVRAAQPDLLPLIADVNTSWAMWDLVRVPRSCEQRGTYGQYVVLAHRWAGELGRRPDEIERALFEIGKQVRSGGRPD